MKIAATFLIGASLLALSACGGAEEANVAANDTVNVAGDDLLLPPDEALEDPLPGDLNATGYDGSEDLNAVDLNAADTNLTADANAAVNAQ